MNTAQIWPPSWGGLLPATAAHLAALLLILSLLGGCAATAEPPTKTFNGELEYLKVINDAGPAKDPSIIFLLMGQYLNANREAEGIAFFESFLQAHGAALAPKQKSLYLAALGLMRASHARQVPLLSRIGWVRETIAMLEQAKEHSGGEIFVVRWISGVVFAQLPGFFDQEQAALADIRWALDNIEKAPHGGWARELYFALALTHHGLGQDEEAARFLALSGYPDFEKEITLTTAFAVNGAKGFTFSPPKLREVVPGRVFALSGFEFTEYYFIISRNGKELIAIDAGTRPDSARRAFERLRARVPNLPPLTTVFVTHAHWDHIGGHRYFRELNPSVRFYARDNYREELSRSEAVPMPYSYFFGSDFRMEFISDFRPEATIAARRKVRVGGTVFDLVPVPGGETNDGMFIHMPEHGVLFVGDFIMPYMGAPFLEEGNVPGLLVAIDRAVALEPKVLLHGHAPLNSLFHSTHLLSSLKSSLAWLRGQTLRAIREGKSRAEVHHLNLVPPGLVADGEQHVPYLVLRENVINRVYDRNVGYWQPGLAGMDHLSRREMGTLFTRYLGLSEDDVAEAVEKMAAAGDYDLAARTLTWAAAAKPPSARLSKVQRTVFLKLKEKYQAFNPFKFIIYSETVGSELAALESP